MARRREKTIMVVDDDKQMRDLLTQLLENVGYRVMTVPNGLKLVSNLKVHKPDLILMDIMMSWINGFELCRILRRSKKFSDIPVIFVTAKSDEEDKNKGLLCGCVDYITKPFDNDHLVSRVNALLKGKNTYKKTE